MRQEDPLWIIKKRLLEANDFPALSKAVAMVSQKAALVGGTSVGELTGNILDDISITNKLLKAVNTFAYASSHMSGKINTISRAIFVAGFERVRNIALSLLLFENLKDQKSVAELKENIVNSFMSGVIAREMSEEEGLADSEEIFIDAVFHNLGKLLVSFIMPMEAKKIKLLIREGKHKEDYASMTVLGVSFEDIGIAIATDWGFSQERIYTMQQFREPRVSPPKTDLETKHRVVCFSNEISSAINNLDPNETLHFMKSAVYRYGDCFELPKEKLVKLIEKAVDELIGYVKNYDKRLASGTFMESVEKLIELVRNEELGTLHKMAGETAAGAPKPKPESRPESRPKPKNVFSLTQSRPMPANAEELLNQGIQDVSISVVEGRSFIDVLNEIVEVMYRAMGFSRVIFFVKNPTQPVLDARYGLGQDVKALMRHLKIPLGTGSDVFNLAMDKKSDLIIPDVDLPQIFSRIPGWYRELIDARTFLLLPIVVGDKQIGLIYADKPGPNEISIPPGTFSLLKILRDHLVMAIQRSQK